MARRNDWRTASQGWPPPDTVVAASGRPGHADENGKLGRTLALVAVVLGLVALTAAACLLSYSSVHAFALQAGVSRSLARIYPVIGDAMLAVAGCSVLALRGAGMISRVYAWLCFILLLAALAAASVVHEAALRVPPRVSEITAAVFPWALVLVAFGLLLALLRHARRRRHNHRDGTGQGPSPAPGSESAALEAPVLERPVLEPTVLEPTAFDARGLPAHELAPIGAGEPDDSETGYEGYDPIVHEAAASFGPGGTAGPAGPGEPAGPFAGPGSTSPSHPYESPLSQSQSQAPPGSPEAEPVAGAEDGQHAPAPPPPAAAGPGGASPTVPFQRPDLTASELPRPAARPAEMQLRARSQRPQPPAEPQEPAEPPSTAATVESYRGDTVPRGELNAAPTSDRPGDGTDNPDSGQETEAPTAKPETTTADAKPATTAAEPPKLERPRSSPTPPK